MYIDVDIVEKNGVQRAIIKVSDSAWNNMQKEPGQSKYDPDNNTAIALDDKHIENELGYIYVENGKTVMKPLAYPGEKYGVYKENEFGVPVLQDVTEQMYKSIELPEEFVDKIKSMLAEQGLTIDFP